MKHSTTNTDWTRQKDDNEPVDIVSAGADLEARRQKRQQRMQASIDAAATPTDWEARALKAEAAVLKYSEWGANYCPLCEEPYESEHKPDCLRAELEARK